MHCNIKYYDYPISLPYQSASGHLQRILSLPELSAAQHPQTHKKYLKTSYNLNKHYTVLVILL